MKRYSLPRVVTLPLAPTIEMTHLRIAMNGASRSLISLWRKDRGFPVSWQEAEKTWISSTDAVADWLQCLGVTVRRR